MITAGRWVYLIGRGLLMIWGAGIVIGLGLYFAQDSAFGALEVAGKCLQAAIPTVFALFFRELFFKSSNTGLRLIGLVIAIFLLIISIIFASGFLSPLSTVGKVAP